ncbi:hypothetical protein B0H17DRAFT_1194699 [Mycena rosella]|uniref:Secreted protein n=1 Tax=Mycena rosella TaxID=1033263 RepID=A0AAD7GNH4_MYCRO|nr:hypothetical protein B0H17DRAFT_1194699 [Mycena rosella]
MLSIFTTVCFVLSSAVCGNVDKGRCRVVRVIERTFESTVVVVDRAISLVNILIGTAFIEVPPLPPPSMRTIAICTQPTPTFSNGAYAPHWPFKTGIALAADFGLRVILSIPPFIAGNTNHPAFPNVHGIFHDPEHYFVAMDCGTSSYVSLFSCFPLAINDAL